LAYQGTRYHLISVPHLSDEGPFTWLGIPSILFTDFDIFNRENFPDYRQISDQPQNLNVDALQQSATILSYFMLITEEPAVLTQAVVTPPNNLIAKTLVRIVKFVQNTILGGYDQYIASGAFSLGFLELASISLCLLFIIHQTSFQAYRELCKACMSEPLNIVARLINHRILFFHLILMVIAICIDTVCAFFMILLGFAALRCIHIRHLNLVTALACCALCCNFLIMDITQMSDYGRRGPKTKELRFMFLTILYAVHSLGVLLYGADYYIKSKLKPHTD